MFALMDSPWKLNLGLQQQNRDQTSFWGRERSQIHLKKSFSETNKHFSPTNIVKLGKSLAFVSAQKTVLSCFNKLPLCHFSLLFPLVFACPPSHSHSQSNRLLTAHLPSDETVHISAFIHKIIKLWSKLFQSLRNSRYSVIG